MHTATGEQRAFAWMNTRFFSTVDTLTWSDTKTAPLEDFYFLSPSFLVPRQAFRLGALGQYYNVFNTSFDFIDDNHVT